MPRAGRLPVETKVEIVGGYISGKIEITEVETRHGIGWTTLRAWVQLYKLRGAIGLAGTTQNRKYAPETKRMAAIEYLNGEGSQSDIGEKYDISDRKMLRQWIRCYNGHGDFKQPNSGGAIYMSKGRDTTLEERIEIVSHCIACNRDYGKTIDQHGISYQQVYSWVMKYEKDGPDGLTDRRGKRKGEASMTEIEKLRAQLKLKEAENLRLQTKDAELIKRISELYQESNGIFGYRRMQRNLKHRFNLHCNKKRIYRVMQAIGMKSVIRRKRPNYIKSTPEITAENIQNRNFVAERLNEKWLTDVSEFKYGDGGKMYPSAILDLKDKSIVSYAIGHSNNSKLAFDTFDAAVQKHPGAKPLFHSDRGFRYTSKVFRAKLDVQGMAQSMSHVGRCIDNGPMEAFGGMLKPEMYYLHRFLDYESLKLAIERYIHFYNNGRFQERLGDLAPLEYRALLQAAA